MPPTTTTDRPDLLPGTLDMLILKTLLFGPKHGHGIASSIRQTTNGVLTVDHGSLYPALHRLARDGWISAKWEVPPDRTREYKCYRLTAAGRKHLVRQESKWDAIVRAIGRVMKPATEG
ncbi:MAG: PadR family transcriptional regulator [Gemmatimonadaceae bacterium]